ncbi:MAG: hypothetical protein EOO69_13465 [Moraxellaceae bacterium]|nr:MAG: hypothetical protein EOO69_13465 [Moraxellaceae bacterium]
MISKQILGQAALIGTMTMVLMGCDKKQEPIKADEPAAVQSTQDAAHKSENDLYIERLNKDVKVENPDALLDEVNQETKKTS